MKWIMATILLWTVHASATPAECKLSFYNFNKSNESTVQAVGVDYGGGSISLGFRQDKAPDLQAQADMASLVRACMGTGMMNGILYKFKMKEKTPHTVCTNFNPKTLGMVCSPHKCEGPKGAPCKPPRLVKGDKNGNPVEIP